MAESDNGIQAKFFDCAKNGKLADIKQLISQIPDINSPGEDGMTGLMYAAYRGVPEVVEYLLQNGADANINTHKDKYTPLMFATLSGSADTVRLLLESGAKPDAVNNINRTAGQLGAFVGRHDCVSVINNFVQTDQIEYYTKKHGFEECPRLNSKLASSLHKMVVIPNLNPVNLVMFIEKHSELLAGDKHKDVLYVLETEMEKAFKDVNEVLAMKLHVFGFVFRKCVCWETNVEGRGGIKGMLKYLLKARPNDGFLIGVESILRDALKTFPYPQSNLFQQIIKSLAPVTPGSGITALAVLTQSINGIQSADFSECCSCCGERHCFNKCSACKVARYCNAKCQKMHWNSHKLMCSDMKKQREESLKQEELERQREKAEREQQEKEKEKEDIQPPKEQDQEVATEEAGITATEKIQELSINEENVSEKT